MQQNKHIKANGNNVIRLNAGIPGAESAQIGPARHYSVASVNQYHLNSQHTYIIL